MEIQTYSPDSTLSKALQEALERSLATSLESLIALRKAAHAYAIHARKSGMTIDELCDRARKVLSEAEENKASGESSPVVRDRELAAHLNKWCRDGYLGGY